MKLLVVFILILTFYSTLSLVSSDLEELDGPQVEKVIVHPRYKNVELHQYNHLALLKTSQSILKIPKYTGIA